MKEAIRKVVRKLRRQKAFIVPEVIPPELRARMNAITAWDSWDPDIDRWEFDPVQFIPSGSDGSSEQR